MIKPPDIAIHSQEDMSRWYDNVKEQYPEENPIPVSLRIDNLVIKPSFSLKNDFFYLHLRHTEGKINERLLVNYRLKEALESLNIEEITFNPEINIWI